MKVDKSKIEIAMLNQGYNKHLVEKILERFPEEIADNLKETYENYIDKGVLTDFEFDGITLLISWI